MTTRRFFCTRSNPRDLASVKAALYGHSRVAGLETNITDGHSQGRTVAIIETNGRTDADAEYAVNYQRERLMSFGGIGVSEPFMDYTQAEFYAGEEYDSYPEMVHSFTPAEYLAREFGTDVSEWTA